MNSFESKKYAVHVADGAGRGTYVVERLSDGKTTMRNTGSDAQYDWHALHKAWAKKFRLFDAICETYDYTD